MPKLVKLVGPSSALAEEISPFFFILCSNALRTLASLRVCLFVYLRDETGLLGLMPQSCLLTLVILVLLLLVFKA